MKSNQTILIGGGLGLAALGLLLFSRKASAESTLTQGEKEWITVETPNTTQPTTGTAADPYNKTPVGQTPRGIRNNNPLNLIATNTPWEGKTGNDGTFEVFKDPYSGIRAAARNLRTYRDKYGLNTISGIVLRWTKGDPAQTQQNYMNFIANKMGISTGATLTTVEQYTQLVTSMIMFENKLQQPYDYSLIQKAVKDGLA
jgi:hypothetical protein